MHPAPDVPSEPTQGPVLVVDDDQDILEATSLLLETEGYRVATARDGQEALDRIAGGLCPSVILLDLMMPGMNGFDFYAELRRLEGPAAHAPVIVISATRELGRHAAELGAEDFIAKPYDLQLLLDKIARRAQPAP